jgi:hypothetical protein
MNDLDANGQILEFFFFVGNEGWLDAGAGKGAESGLANRKRGERAEHVVIFYLPIRTEQAAPCSILEIRGFPSFLAGATAARYASWLQSLLLVPPHIEARSMSRRVAALAILAATIHAGLCGAAEYAYVLPEVIGSPHGELNLAVSLGGEFASISIARLHIIGAHLPGLLGDLNSPATYPYPAEIDAYSPAKPFGNSGILGELLPAVAGPFAVDRPFRRVSPGGSPDLSAWLDGTANFYFSAGPSAYVAIYRTIANPIVTISSATLFVTGERLDAGAATGDFDGDGTVDGHDLGMWQAAFQSDEHADFSSGDADGDADGADFLVWQRQLGGSASSVAATAPAPEPASSAILLVAASMALIARRCRT